MATCAGMAKDRGRLRGGSIKVPKLRGPAAGWPTEGTTQGTCPVQIAGSRSSGVAARYDS